MSVAAPSRGFDRALVAHLDEPVRRYFAHAIAAGAPLVDGARLTMRGRIKVGPWLPFDAVQEGGAGWFVWSADVGPGPLTLLRVVDRYAGAAGSMEFRAFGRLRLSRAGGEHITRSAAGRSALESVMFAPATLLPGSGVTWHAEADDQIAASFELPPERPQVHARIDERGAMVADWAQRWGETGRKSHGYVPFGCDVLSERRFGDYTIPDRVRAGWWYGSERYEPFFEATITEYTPRLEAPCATQ